MQEKERHQVQERGVLKSSHTAAARSPKIWRRWSGYVTSINIRKVHKQMSLIWSEIPLKKRLADWDWKRRLWVSEAHWTVTGVWRSDPNAATVQGEYPSLSSGQGVHFLFSEPLILRTLKLMSWKLQAGECKSLTKASSRLNQTSLPAEFLFCGPPWHKQRSLLDPSKVKKAGTQ